MNEPSKCACGDPKCDRLHHRIGPISPASASSTPEPIPAGNWTPPLVAPQPAPSSPTKQVPERTISDECRWCAEGEPEWSPDAKCWIHRRPNLDKRCLRKRLSPVGERADAEDAAESIQVGGSVAPSSPSADPDLIPPVCEKCGVSLASGNGCHMAQPTPVESTGLEEQALLVRAEAFWCRYLDKSGPYPPDYADVAAAFAIEELKEKDAQLSRLSAENGELKKEIQRLLGITPPTIGGTI